MKRCPECRRDYYDDTLRFCLDDGSALLEGPASHEAKTEILPGAGLNASVLKAQLQLEKSSTDKSVLLSQAMIEMQPSESGALVGRVAEIADIRGSLENDDVRLVTLTGIGGTGKTRLAKEIGRQLWEQYPGSVFFIELASVNDPELVIPTIAHALSMKETGAKSIVEALADRLSNRPSLLILDNLEQVVDTGVQLVRLVTSVPGLKLLVTSREPLKVSLETEYQVMPLALPLSNENPSLSELMKVEAVQLFVQRAKQSRADFELTEPDAQIISKICYKLDGLPLALELAAARTKILSLAEILARLEDRLSLLTGGARDLPGRQRTIRAAIEWSYALLTEEEKMVFRTLSVFQGGFSFDAAESVISLKNNTVRQSGDRVKPDVLDVITSLSEKSLLISAKPNGGKLRFSMLGVVRDVAQELLRESSDAEAANRSHAEHFLKLSEDASPHLRTADSGVWLDRLETEHDNLRAAIRWSVANDSEMATRIVVGIRFMWTIHGHLREAQHWLIEVLAVAADVQPRLRWELMTGLGNMYQFRGDLEPAQKIYQQCLDESLPLDDRKYMALSLRGIGATEYLQSDFSSAHKRLNEAYEISLSIDDEFGASAALGRLGDIILAEGNPADARVRVSDVLETYRRIGYRQGIASKLNILGMAEYLDGDLESSNVHLNESLQLSLELGDAINTLLALVGLAAQMTSRDDFYNAAILSGAAARMAEAIEFELEPAEAQFRDHYVERLRTSMTEDDFAMAYEAGRNMLVNDITTLALGDGDVRR